MRNTLQKTPKQQRIDNFDARLKARVEAELGRSVGSSITQEQLFDSYFMEPGTSWFDHIKPFSDNSRSCTLEQFLDIFIKDCQVTYEFAYQLLAQPDDVITGVIHKLKPEVVFSLCGVYKHKLKYAMGLNSFDLEVDELDDTKAEFDLNWKEHLPRINHVYKTILSPATEQIMSDVTSTVAAVTEAADTTPVTTPEVMPETNNTSAPEAQPEAKPEAAADAALKQAVEIELLYKNALDTFIKAAKSKNPAEELRGLDAVQTNRVYAAALVCYSVKTKTNLINVSDGDKQSVETLVSDIHADNIRRAARIVVQSQARTSDELLKSYADLGPIYAGTPLGVDFGLEIGVGTGDDDSKQRTGFIIGLRSDHARQYKPGSGISWGAK